LLAVMPTGSGNVAADIACRAVADGKRATAVVHGPSPKAPAAAISHFARR